MISVEDTGAPMPDLRQTLSVEDERDLVRSLAAAVLAQAAPEELAVFDETVDEYFSDPDGVLTAARRDEAVGFGLDLAMMTPYVLAVVVPVVQLLAGIAGEAVHQEVAPVARGFVRRLIRRSGSPIPAGGSPENADPPAGSPLGTPRLSAEQGRQVRAVAFARAVALGVPEPQAGLLADAVTGGLVVGS
jgi:hypothetical protein